ncbi:hypothetical protein DPMN_016140 [Dreissena polymorpha]|uniref:Uncharacterized protein n=1 Tax=Dreissena polymorpha TaxID=45954 RepID=A0A9D4NDZ5_DREPO|nr:hypothetical protein DPMN_016140 [Dreissena polymorpha]
MNLLTKFHEDWTINVASRVKNAPPLGIHVFQAKVTIFELIQDISGTNLLSKFHEDWKINVDPRVLTRKNAPPPGGHVFQSTGIIFELIQDIIGMNLFTKFYEDQTINVASRIHVFQANITIFQLIQDIIETNLLTKFHEDWTINVASRTTDKKRSQKLTMSTLCSVIDIILSHDSSLNDCEQMNQIQLVTKFGEDRMKCQDRPTDLPTDKVTPI